jgi:S-adenosylmethionine uptake transporter
MSATTEKPRNNARVGIGFIVLAMFCISVNDMIIKQLSGSYPLHQMVFVRSGIGIAFSLVILQFEGGFRSLRTDRAGLHLLRGLLVVIANMAFFAALAAIPLADATALFFVAPLFITLLSIPFLGEKVGGRRLAAVFVGFAGVLVMLRPGVDTDEQQVDRLILLLPVIGAFTYAGMQILTRRLGVASTASAMAVYIQGTFILVSSGFWIVAGDGRYAKGIENESVLFLLRAWTWPAAGDWSWFALLGLMSAVIGYSLSQAYRSANAATIAPFEYVAMPMAVLWGWLVFGHLPDLWVSAGILLIASSGVYVFLREKRKARSVASRRPVRRY